MSSSIAAVSAARKKTCCCRAPITSTRLLFKVIPEKAKEVKPGEVAVIVSNIGKDPSEEIRRTMAAKVRERLEREEQEQLALAAAHLDKMDGKVRR